MKNKQIDQALQEINSNLINLGNVSNLVEIVEVGRGIFSVEDQAFWGSVVNCIVLRVDEFDLKDLTQIVHILDQLGFNDLTVTPNLLPDHLLVKQNKLIKKFQKKVVTNYLLDQIEIHGNDLIFSECKTVSDLR